MASTTRLNLLPYLQNWDGASLSLRLLAIPRASPLDPLAAGAGPSFATANFVFDVNLVQGLDAIPTLATPLSTVTVAAPQQAQAKNLFDQLATVFPIDPAPGPANPRSGLRTFRKYLPPTYRDAIGYSEPRNGAYTVADHSYFCSLRSGASNKPPYKKIKPPVAPKFPWGKVIAIAMRHPTLATTLGLVQPLVIDVKAKLAADFFKEGGWVFVALNPASDGYGLTAITDGLKVYAARVPPLTQARTLFTPVLFPVAATTPPPGPYDDLFLEV